MAAGVADAVAFVDDYSGEGVVVAGFDCGLVCPFGEGCSGGVFAFDDEALSVDVDAGDVAAIVFPVFDSFVYSVVVEGGGEVVGYLAFESGAELFG